MTALPPGITPTEATLMEALIKLQGAGRSTTTVALAQDLGWPRSRAMYTLHGLRDRNRVQNVRDEDGSPLGWVAVCWTCDGDGAVFHGSMEQLCPSCNGTAPLPSVPSVAVRRGRSHRRQQAARTVLAVLAAGPRKIDALAEAIGWSRRSTSDLMQELAHDGDVRCEGRLYHSSHRAGRAGADVGEASKPAPTKPGHQALADRGIGEGPGGASC